MWPCGDDGNKSFTYKMIVFLHHLAQTRFWYSFVLKSIYKYKCTFTPTEKRIDVVEKRNHWGHECKTPRYRCTARWSYMNTAIAWRVLVREKRHISFQHNHFQTSFIWIYLFMLINRPIVETFPCRFHTTVKRMVQLFIFTELVLTF